MHLDIGQTPYLPILEVDWSTITDKVVVKSESEPGFPLAMSICD